MCNLYISLWCPGTDFFSQQFYFIWSGILILLCPAVWFTRLLTGQVCLVCTSVGWSGLFGLHVCWMVRPVWFAHLLTGQACLVCTSVGWSGLFGLHVCWMVKPVWFAHLLDGQACLVCTSVGWSGLFGLHICWMVRPVWFARLLDGQACQKGGHSSSPFALLYIS